MLQSFMAFGFLLPFLTAVGLLMFVLIDGEMGILATIMVAITAAIVQWGFSMDMLGYARQNPMSLLYGAIAYLVVGTAWGIGKWWFFVRAERRKYDEIRARFMADIGLPPTAAIPEDKKETFSRLLYRVEVKPDPTNHKTEIYTWMAYWPWSFTWTLINDPVKRAFDWVYARVSGMLKRMSVTAFAGTEGDLPSTRGKE